MELRVITIVISSLFLVIAIAWIDALEIISSYVFFTDNKNLLAQQHAYQKKLFSAILVTVLCLGIIVFILIATSEKYNNDQT